MANASATTQYSPPWVPEPNGRGTWDILYSCIFTLSLCVWSAIHLNIPPKGENDWWQFGRKTKRLVIAVFAPEMVLYSAWQQYYLAERFSKELQNVCRERQGYGRDERTTWWEDMLDRLWDCSLIIFGVEKQHASEKPDTPVAPSPPLWQRVYTKLVASRTKPPALPKKVKRQLAKISLTYGFYVVMGGFTVDAGMLYDNLASSTRQHPTRTRRLAKRLDKSWSAFTAKFGKKPSETEEDDTDAKSTLSQDIDGGDPVYVTLTPRGVIELAQSMSWDDFWQKFFVEQDSIRDKSKADSLNKMLVSIQVLWALLNSVSRLYLGYSISVLEIHTLVHAGCAMIIYGLWWKRPLDIRDSTVIKASDFNQTDRGKLALLLMRSVGSAFRPLVNFTMLDEWYRFQCPSEPRKLFHSKFWPNSAYGCEAGFLWVDVSRSVPDESYHSEDEKHEVQLLTIGCSNTSLPTADEVGTQSACRTSSESPQLPCPEPADLEANTTVAATESQQREAGTNATVVRRPPDLIASARDLSSGQLLPSGIGPAALVTGERTRSKHDNWDGVDEWGNDYFPWFSALVKKYKPQQRSIVEVDPQLKNTFRLPFDLKIGAWVGARNIAQDDATYHKLSIAVSEKDLLQWTLACRAFRAGLGNCKKPVTSLGFLPEPTAKKPKAKNSRGESAAQLPEESQESSEGAQTAKPEGNPVDVQAHEVTVPSPADAAEEMQPGTHQQESPSEDASSTRGDSDLTVEQVDKTAPSTEQQPQSPTTQAEPTDDPDNATADSEEQSLPVLLSLQTPIEDPKTASFFNVSSFCLRSSNLDLDALGSFSSRHDHARSYFGIVVYLVISAISGIYAGIHLALWNHDFPTRAEKIMWRISSTTFGAPAAVLAAAAVILTATFYIMLFMTVGQNVGKNPKCIAFFAWLEDALGPLGSCLGTAFRWVKLGAVAIGAAFAFVFKGIAAGCRAIFEHVLRPLGRGLLWVLKPVGALIANTAKAVTNWYQMLDKNRRDDEGRVSLLGTSNWCMATFILPLPLWLLFAAFFVVLFALFLALCAPVVGAVLLYIFARGYIVAESFLDLRHVPVGVYQDVSWAQYIPHL